jgi:hypothetical protein
MWLDHYAVCILMVRIKNKPIDVFRHMNTHGNDPNVCWEWTSSTSGRDDRGYFNLNGKRTLAHRVVFEVFTGRPIPEGMVVRHKCDNPICCNPSHLELGTRSQNELDKYDRDRSGYTHAMIAQIRRKGKLRDAQKHGKKATYQQIADEINEEFGTKVSRQNVSRILQGKARVGHGEIDEEDEDDDDN